VLRGSSHAELWGSSHAELWGSSHAVLRESSHAELRGSSHATATPYASITDRGPHTTAKGGVIIKVPRLDTAEKWCEFHGVKVQRGQALLYKALRPDWTSPHKMSYAPGSKPVAPDWDGGKVECGGGLHFSPHPRLARDFLSGDDVATAKYVGCWVRLADIAVDPDGQMPDKVKARAVAKPCFEVTVDGEPVTSNRGRVLGEPVDLAIEQLANIEALTNPPVTS
jgi:hypothetical protein